MQVPSSYFFAYFIFFSALIVTIRTDLETMLISRLVTIFLIPFGIFFSAFEFLPISVTLSISGALVGYFILYGIERIFFVLTKNEGMGQGDLDLAAFIGSFIGPLGCWITLMLGSILGSIVGIVYVCIYKQSRYVKIPFGPFLALGAILFVLFQNQLLALLFPALGY